MAAGAHEAERCDRLVKEEAGVDLCAVGASSKDRALDQSRIKQPEGRISIRAQG